MRQPTALERDQLRERLIQKIRDTCPTDEQCLEDEESCFSLHPVHPAAYTNGVIDMVYAEVEPLVDLIMEEVWPTTDASTPGPS